MTVRTKQIFFCIRNDIHHGADYCCDHVTRGEYFQRGRCCCRVIIVAAKSSPLPLQNALQRILLSLLLLICLLRQLETSHTEKDVSRCFAALRQLRQIRHSASSHISDAGGRTRPLQARLRQQCSSRYPSLSDAETAVRPQCSGTAHLSPPPLRPHQ